MFFSLQFSPFFFCKICFASCSPRIFAPKPAQNNPNIPLVCPARPIHAFAQGKLLSGQGCNNTATHAVTNTATAHCRGNALCGPRCNTYCNTHTTALQHTQHLLPHTMPHTLHRDGTRAMSSADRTSDEVLVQSNSVFQKSAWPHECQTSNVKSEMLNVECRI